ncbi:hypothetical protein E4U61_001507 [Claviceps capensis]|nr:hypothetical protein E4U61_001507 [Claviceps capensis]
MSILETGSVLKTTDFDVNWFANRQHFTNPPALRLCEPAVVHEAWKPVARRPNAKASSTARGSTRNELTDRNDVEAAHRPASLLIKVLFLVPHKLRCERSLGTVYLAAARAKLRATPGTALAGGITCSAASGVTKEIHAVAI